MEWRSGEMTELDGVERDGVSSRLVSSRLPICYTIRTISLTLSPSPTGAVSGHSGR